MCVSSCLIATVAAGAQLTTPAQPSSPASSSDEIVVVGDRSNAPELRGTVPLHLMDADEIRASPAGSAADLLELVRPHARSATGGEPVTLLNGRRISGFSEIKDLPREAIARVEVFPEEVALRYGFRADQRVVNFVLRPRFRAITTEPRAGMAMAGGRGSLQSGGNILRLGRNGRWQIAVEHEQKNRLLESERALRRPEGEPLFEQGGRFRTLLPEERRLSVNGTLSRVVGGNIAMAANLRLGGSSSRSLLGAASRKEAQAATRHRDDRAGQLGLAFSGGLAGWRWSATATYDRSRSDTRTALGGARQWTGSISESSNAELVASGVLMHLPGGRVLGNFKAGYEARGLDSEMFPAEAEASRPLRRRKPNAQASLDIPLSDSVSGVSRRIGKVSANLHGALAQLSDFGRLRTFGYGLTWAPAAALSFSASFSDDDGAPSMQQLGSPLLVTPNMPVFDFSRSETVLAEQLEGGNPALRTANRKLWSLSANVRPASGLALHAHYSRARIRNPIAAFPMATPELEAAFPERFVRGPDGRLVRIDMRPVNFARSAADQLRTGAVYSGAAPWGGGTGRLQAAFSHSWRLRDDMLVRKDEPELDLLGGSAAGNLGGHPRHELDFQLGYWERGLGARLGGSWRAATTVRGGPGAKGEAGKLFFSDFASVNLNLFADIGGGAGWLGGMRLSLEVDNLLDGKRRVRDGSGATPLGYQPGYLDPLGRSIRVSVRKQLTN